MSLTAREVHWYNSVVCFPGMENVTMSIRCMRLERSVTAKLNVLYVPILGDSGRSKVSRKRSTS